MSNRKFTGSMVLSLVILVLSAAASAKRSAPADVPPLRVGDIEFRVANSPSAGSMGFVEAHDAATGELIWSRQIYVVVKHADLEGDVQDVFITKIRHEGDALIIDNERGSQYRLDLSSLEVKTVKGTVRVETKK